MENERIEKDLEHEKKWRRKNKKKKKETKLILKWLNY